MTIDELARKYGFSSEAVNSMAKALVDGELTMAQFQHPEFGGSGQWMRGGMLMLSDMFNHGLKARVDGLCVDLAEALRQAPEKARASVSRGWWGEDLGSPASSGGQNGDRYAYFPQKRRLAVEDGGQLTIYDTLDHDIGGFSQQQSGGRRFAMTSQHGALDLSDLPVVSGQAGARSQPAPTPSTADRETDVFEALEKLAGLRERGVLTEEEFTAKKKQLLERL